MVNGDYTEEEVGTYEAKNRLSALVDAAAHGKRIWITKHGKRVALLSSGIGSPAPSETSALEVFRSIRSRAKHAKGSLKDLIEEGRR